jgi:hypothetical protein
MILFWKRRQAFLFRSGGIKALPPGRAFAGQLAGSTRYRHLRNTAAGAGNLGSPVIPVVVEEVLSGS